MNVLYILPQPYFLPRGSSFRAAATLRVAAALGHRVDLLCYDIGSDPPGEEYAIYRSWRPSIIKHLPIGPSIRKLLLDLPLSAHAARLVRSGSYDILHGVEESGFIASRLSRVHGIPYVYDMHSWISQQIESTSFARCPGLLPVFRRLEERAMQGAGAIITVGSEMSDILKTRLPPSIHVATLPDCPLPFDDEVPGDRKSFIEQSFFPEGRRTILYTGNYHGYQGIPLLLDAIAELKKRVAGQFDFALLLVGGGAGEQDTVNTCRKQVSALGIEDHVVFCGEFPATEVPIFMQRANLLVSSRTSGNNVPLKIHTYLASGVPLVATRTLSHTQVLNDRNCLLADPNPESLAQALYHGLATMTDEERKNILLEAGTYSPEDQWASFRETVRVCYEKCLSSGQQ